jgi:dTDP-4-dehydrorhamnose reductase
LRLRIIVIGKQGQVAQALVERGLGQQVGIVCIGRPEVDLTEPDTVARAIEAARGSVIVNAAAYTAVDKAETEPDIALRVNAGGAQAVAEAAARTGRPIVQISTDYVFDGALERPYREHDPVGPVNVYGRTKLEGERAVALANPRHVIVRTSWVYSPFGANFIKTMLRLGLTRRSIQVVGDQWGAPTSAFDIADALLHIARRLVAQPENTALHGVFHMTASGETNWAGFAAVVFEQASRHGRAPVQIEPIAAAQYPTPARRPANSRLDVGHLQNVYCVALPEWRVSVRACVSRLMSLPEAERPQA